MGLFQSSKLAVAAALLSALPFAATAQSLSANAQAIEILDRVGYQRALVERMASHACHINVGAHEGDTARVQRDVLAFEATLDMVRNGTNEVNAVRAPRPLHYLKNVDEAWVVYSNFARYSTRGEMPDAYLRGLVDAEPEMLASLEKFIQAMGRVYGVGRMTPFETATLNNIAKMRMLASKIALNHCQILSSTFDATSSAAVLEGNLTTLETAVELAISGNEDARIIAADGAALEALTCVQNDLLEVRTLIMPSIQSASTTLEAVDASALLLMKVEADANAALTAFEQALLGEASTFTDCVSVELMAHL